VECEKERKKRSNKIPPNKNKQHGSTQTKRIRMKERIDIADVNSASCEAARASISLFLPFLTPTEVSVLFSRSDHCEWLLTAAVSVRERMGDWIGVQPAPPVSARMHGAISTGSAGRLRPGIGPTKLRLRDFIDASLSRDWIDTNAACVHQ
jgi:hypothetical protein